MRWPGSAQEELDVRAEVAVTERSEPWSLVMVSLTTSSSSGFSGSLRSMTSVPANVPASMPTILPSGPNTLVENRSMKLTVRVPSSFQASFWSRPLKVVKSRNDTPVSTLV